MCLRMRDGRTLAVIFSLTALHSTNSKKYQVATKRESRTKVVTPDWVYKSVAAKGELCSSDETCTACVDYSTDVQILSNGRWCRLCPSTIFHRFKILLIISPLDLITIVV